MGGGRWGCLKRREGEDNLYMKAYSFKGLPPCMPNRDSLYLPPNPNYRGKVGGKVGPPTQPGMGGAYAGSAETAGETGTLTGSIKPGRVLDKLLEPVNRRSY